MQKCNQLNKLTKWSPYGFDQLSQVMDLYFHHFTLLMARFVCTVDQYRERRIKFNFHTLAWFAISTFLNVTSIVILILISFKWTPLDYVNRCWELLIQVGIKFHIYKKADDEAAVVKLESISSSKGYAKNSNQIELKL